MDDTGRKRKRNIESVNTTHVCGIGEAGFSGAAR